MVNALDGLSAGIDFSRDLQSSYDRSRLNMLAGKAYETPQADRQALLGQMARVSPAAAQMQQQQWQGDEDRQTKLLVNGARYMKGAIDSKNPSAVAGAWNNLRPAIIRAGLATEQELSPTWDPSYEQTMHQLLGMDGSDLNGATPTDVRSFQMMTAGLSPEDQMRARRINLGLDGRESSAAISYQKIKGADGREYLVATDPRQIGAQFVGGGAGYGSFSGQPENGPPVDGGGLDFASDAQQFASLGIPVSSTVRSAERNREVGGVGNSYHLTGEAMDIAPQNAQQKQQAQQYWRSRGYQVIDEGDHLHVEPPRRGMTTSRLPGGQNPFASRRPEDEARAVEQAKSDVQLANLPTELNLRTQADIEKARGVEQAKTEAERAAQAQKRIKQYEQSIASAGTVGTSIDKAIGLIGPTTTGWSGARLRNIEGTHAYDLASEIETIKANLGFDRLQQMRDNSPTGGALGAIAVQELVALQSTIANLDPNQSDDQLKSNLQRVKQHYGNWVSAVQQSLADERAQKPAGSQLGAGEGDGQPVARKRARNPQTGEVIELRNGQWVPVK